MGMDSSSAQDHHHQEIIMGSQTLESMLGCTSTIIPQQQEKKAIRPSDEASLKCPRCDSTNTKFCYYNNYSLSQPRYFCKSCRRYWTKGGTLRNVPVGGGCRKNKRISNSSNSSSSINSSSSSKKINIHDHHQPISTIPNSLSYDHSSNDLSLAIATLQKQQTADHFSILGNPNMPLMPHHHHDQILGMNNSAGYFVENNSTSGNFQNMYNYGLMGINGNHQELGMGFDDFNGNAVKQETCNGRELGENNNGVFWNFPWKNFEGNNGGGGNSNNNIGEIDSGRVNWNGIGMSNWHGLLNSPLM